MKMIDADAHVIESEATWQYLDAAFQARRPLPVTLPADTNFRDWNAFWIIDQKVRHFGGTPTTCTIARAKSFTIPVQELTDVAARLEVMDRLNVEKQIVQPSFCLSTMTEDPELEAALMQSYNTFMSKVCVASRGRLYFNAVVPFRSPQVAVREIGRLRGMGGMVSVLARGIEWDKPLDHPSFYPIYAEAQRQHLPIVVHLGPGCPTLSAMFDGQSRPAAEAKTFFPPRGRRLVSTLAVQYGFYALLESSLLDEFPTLRWAFLEGGGSEWVAAAMAAIERAGKQNCRRYFDEGRIFVGCEPDEDLLYVISRLGPDVLVAASDMPHFDEAAHTDVLEEYEERGDLSGGVLEKLVRNNAARLFHLEQERSASPLVAEEVAHDG